MDKIPVSARRQRVGRESGYSSLDDAALPSVRLQREILSPQETNKEILAYSSDNEEMGRVDEFGDFHNVRNGKGTGRLRKKSASRGQGGIFRLKKRKRRIYSCCIGSEIDTAKLHEYLDNLSPNNSPLKSKWNSELYTDTLHITRSLDNIYGQSDELIVPKPAAVTFHPTFEETPEIEPCKHINDFNNFSAKFNLALVKEIFVFEFGAVVFWGFPAGEESEMLNIIREFVSKELTSAESFTSNDDDMALILVPPTSPLSISGDVLCLPEDTITKQRLAMSFALGQSTVLAVFESQVETKIPEYEHLPLTLANTGRIFLPSATVGKMIGELFVIRHKLNLHTDILDTPDFFWEEEQYTPEYELLWNYLEMSSRVEVLNKRLDMIKELLRLLHANMENAERVSLDWIVIWLIVIYCFVEVGGIML